MNSTAQKNKGLQIGQEVGAGEQIGGPTGDSPRSGGHPAAGKASAKRPRLKLTRDLLKPTEYVRLLNGEFSQWAFNEERALELKGRWRQAVYQAGEGAPVDLEIGTGNGYHFAHLATKSPERGLLGIELKFKPLIQSIRRALKAGAENARIARYDAAQIGDLFDEGELNNVYIHFPDPWPKERQWKHRLIQDDFLIMLHKLMRPGTFVDFKTDSLDYFEWAMERFRKSPFELTRETRDLHHSEWKDENFVTHFERIFLNQGVKINYARLVRR